MVGLTGPAGGLGSSVPVSEGLAMRNGCPEIVKPGLSTRLSLGAMGWLPGDSPPSSAAAVASGVGLA